MRGGKNITPPGRKETRAGERKVKSRKNWLV